MNSKKNSNPDCGNRIKGFELLDKLKKEIKEDED